MEESKIRTIAESALAETDELFLVDIKIKGNVGNQKVLVFIDGDTGISIDECAKISRQIGSQLEEEDIMPGKYALEVSSPGLDYPLTMSRQYKKNIGRELIVEMNSGESIEGILNEVNDSIRMEVKGELRVIPIEEIKQSKVKISFK